MRKNRYLQKKLVRVSKTMKYFLESGKKALHKNMISKIKVIRNEKIIQSAESNYSIEMSIK